LQSGHVGGLGHLTTKRINLPGKVAFRQASDSGVAGHLTDGIRIYSQQQCLASHPGSSQSSLDPGVTGSDYDNVVFLWINEHLAFQHPSYSKRKVIHVNVIC
jgi:hypothetical protein